MDWQILILVFIALTLVVGVLNRARSKHITVTVELYLQSVEKNKQEIPEDSATCTKQCVLEFLPEKGMLFDAAGIGPASIQGVIASDTYFPKIVCELSLSKSNGEFEEAFIILKEEKWLITNR
jgi:hypothetical protein